MSPKAKNEEANWREKIGLGDGRTQRGTFCNGRCCIPKSGMEMSSGGFVLDRQVDMHRKEDQFHTQAGWLDSRHSFSFGPHYDPSNTHHGLLLVSNDDVIRAGTGFDTHPHRDMEIVTWVLDGELEHKDSQGNKGLIYPGLAQRMSAGAGIWHSEKNNSLNKDVHLIQMWVTPDTDSIAPSYEQL